MIEVFDERVNEIIIENMKKKESAYGFLSISQKTITHGLYSWYVNHDLAAAKQWFYVAAKCVAISTTKPMGYATLWTCHEFMLPLLSDSPEMMALFAELSPPGYDEKRNNPREGEFQSYLAQIAIKSDRIKLQQLIDLMRVKGLKN